MLVGATRVAEGRERIVVRPDGDPPEPPEPARPPAVTQRLGAMLRLLRRLRGEDDRLQSALTCPYCKDDFRLPEATVCGRDGCGAFYHPECWDECCRSYGGCGVYGCGCTRGHEVGPDALQRRMRRMLLAAALFPPRAVRRLSDMHGEGLRAVYADAVEQRDAIARSPRRSFRVGIFAMAASFLVAMLVIANADPNWVRSDGFAYVIPIFFLVPLPFFAAPFFAYLFWGLVRWLARGFRGELAALGRAEKTKAKKDTV
jgi:hypothetical protein